MNQRSNCQHPLDHRKSKGFQKNFCFTDYAKAFDNVDHNKLWKILQDMGIPDHLTCLLRNLFAGQEATVRTRHGTMDWFTIGKGVRQGCILSPCLFNFYNKAVYCHPVYLTSMLSRSCRGKCRAGWNHKLESRLPEEISTSSDMQMITTLMAGREEELKSLLMRVKKEWKSWLETQHLKN